MSVSVHNDSSNTSAAAELAEFRKITPFLGKTQYLMHTLYVYSPNVDQRCGAADRYQEQSLLIYYALLYSLMQFRLLIRKFNQ